MKIVGLDLSLTSTGIAALTDGHAHVDRIQSKACGDHIADRSHRLRSMVTKITTWAANADLAVVEGPAYGSKTGHMHDRSGLWWLTVARLTGMGLQVVEIPPTVVKKYATGKGGGPDSSKDQVLAAVIRRYPAVDVSGNDEADALILAAMGARHLGHPIDDLPQLHLDAMSKVAWPETAAAS